MYIKLLVQLAAGLEKGRKEVEIVFNATNLNYNTVSQTRVPNFKEL